MGIDLNRAYFFYYLHMYTNKVRLPDHFNVNVLEMALNIAHPDDCVMTIVL